MPIPFGEGELIHFMYPGRGGWRARGLNHANPLPPVQLLLQEKGLVLRNTSRVP
jgi:hypothetical protein